MGPGPRAPGSRVPCQEPGLPRPQDPGPGANPQDFVWVPGPPRSKTPKGPGPGPWAPGIIPRCCIKYKGYWFMKFLQNFIPFEVGGPPSLGISLGSRAPSPGPRPPAPGPRARTQGPRAWAPGAGPGPLALGLARPENPQERSAAVPGTSADHSCERNCCGRGLVSGAVRRPVGHRCRRARVAAAIFMPRPQRELSKHRPPLLFK